MKSMNKKIITIGIAAIIILFLFNSLLALLNNYYVPYTVEATGMSSTLKSQNENLYTYQVVYQYEHNGETYMFTTTEFHATEFDYVGFTYFVAIDEKTGEMINSVGYDLNLVVRGMVMNVIRAIVIGLIIFIVYIKCKDYQLKQNGNNNLNTYNTVSNTQNNSSKVIKESNSSKYDSEDDPFADFYKKQKQ